MVAEPVPEPEDADLLAGPAGGDQVTEVAPAAAELVEALLEALVHPEAAPDRDPHRQRAGREQQRRPPRVDDADQEGRRCPLQVHRAEQERAPTRSAR